MLETITDERKFYLGKQRQKIDNAVVHIVIKSFRFHGYYYFITVVITVFLYYIYFFWQNKPLAD